MTQSAYAVRPYTPADHDGVVAIWRDRFGDVFDVVLDDLEAAASSGTLTEAFVGVDERDRVRGFVLGSVCPAEEIDELGVEPLPPSRLAAAGGHVSEIAVRERDEGRGLGGWLLDRLHEWFAESAASRLYTVSWQRPGHDSEDLFASRGYERLQELPDHYDSRTSCPVCGGRCSCDALLLSRRSSTVDDVDAGPTGPSRGTATCLTDGKGTTPTGSPTSDRRPPN